LENSEILENILNIEPPANLKRYRTEHTIRLDFLTDIVNVSYYL